MSDPDAQHKIGRRERKRRQTHLAIATAAVDLAHERGFDRVTVDAICERADVSRTTFFNYYPSRDDAILGTSLRAASSATVDAVFAPSAGNPVACVLSIAVPALRMGTSGSDLGPRRTQLITSSPNALRRYSAGLVHAQASLVEVTSTWLEQHPEHARLQGQAEREANLAVMIAYSSMYAYTNGWLRPLTTATDEQLFREGPRRFREILANGAAEQVIDVSAIIPVSAPSESVVGHRERKRRATEERIQQNAVRLARDASFEAVTVEAICEGADVSRSTFFNYFPSREAAILGSSIEIIADSDVAAVISAAGGDLTAAALGVIVASIGPGRIGTPLARERAALAQEQPAALLGSMIVFVDSGTELIDALARGIVAASEGRTSTDEAAIEAAFAANAAYALLSVIDGGWLEVAASLAAAEPKLRQARQDLQLVAE